MPQLGSAFHFLHSPRYPSEHNEEESFGKLNASVVAPPLLPCSRGQGGNLIASRATLLAAESFEESVYSLAFEMGSKLKTESQTHYTRYSYTKWVMSFMVINWYLRINYYLRITPVSSFLLRASLRDSICANRLKNALFLSSYV